MKSKTNRIRRRRRCSWRSTHIWLTVCRILIMVWLVCYGANWVTVRSKDGNRLKRDMHIGVNLRCTFYKYLLFFRPSVRPLYSVCLQGVFGWMVNVHVPSQDSLLIVVSQIITMLTTRATVCVGVREGSPLSSHRTYINWQTSDTISVATVLITL